MGNQDAIITPIYPQSASRIVKYIYKFKLVSVIHPSVMRIKDCLILLEVFFPIGIGRAWDSAPEGLVENFARTFAKTAVTIYLPPRVHHVGMLPAIRRMR